jgi:hypothetical protein
MNSIIFCEGRVDAVLIGQYLAANRGWVYSKAKEKLKIQPEDKCQLINIYRRNDDWVYIWAVGGRTRFHSPLQKIIDFNKTVANVSGFQNIIILVDNDDGDEVVIQEEFCSCFPSINLKSNEWGKLRYLDGFGQNSTSKVMLTIVPFNEKGALETVMINALAEEDDEAVILQCQDFVDNIKTKKYLLKRREKLKAKLATIVSIISPDRAVDSRVEIVEGIDWNKYNTVNEAFHKLLEL